MNNFVVTLLVLLGLSFFFDFVFRFLFDAFLHYLFKTCVKQRVGINKTLKYLESKSKGTMWTNADMDFCVSHLKCLRGEDEDVD